MSDSEIILKAAIKRIAARIGKKLVNSAEELADIAQETPQKLKDEWATFKNEVIEESERLEKEIKKTNQEEVKNTNKKLSKEELIQIKIDKLRSKVININRKIEEKN